VEMIVQDDKADTHIMFYGTKISGHYVDIVMLRSSWRLLFTECSRQPMVHADAHIMFYGTKISGHYVDIVMLRSLR
jgi:hypothetical protein